MTEQMLDTAVVRIDGDTQPRVQIDQQVVTEYAELVKAGTEMPAVEVVHDGADYWLVDGFHRFFAHRIACRPQIRAVVTTGMKADAQWKSLAANKTHGLRRTNPDKQKAVIKALRLRPDVTDRDIAEHIGVHFNTVSKYRESLERASTITNCDSRVARDGRRMNTSRIGRGSSKSRRSAGPARNGFVPVRATSQPRPMTALNMPHDPEMGARTLIELFSADYLRALSTFLVKHLEGVAA